MRGCEIYGVEACGEEGECYREVHEGGVVWMAVSCKLEVEMAVDCGDYVPHYDELSAG